MFVPGHVVSMYVATGGASGLSLGSDEKEIILLVFAIIDAATNKVSPHPIYIISMKHESNTKKLFKTPDIYIFNL